MKTTAGDLRACLLRLLSGGFAVAETPVYLLSRDGESLRSIENVKYQRSQDRFLVERSEDEGKTVSVSELLIFCQARPAAEVRLIADGFTAAHGEPLDAVKLACEIIQLRTIDLEDPLIVLCT